MFLEFIFSPLSGVEWMERKIKQRSFGTHSGSFHADEVTACALLLLFDQIDREQIIRSRDLKELSTCDYVCDVGGIYAPEIRRFDHHQIDYHGTLSSAGMVLAYLKDQSIVESGLFYYFNRCLVMGVDAIDNGREMAGLGYCSFSAVIANFVPARHDVDRNTMDRGFSQALDFAHGHLKRLLAKFDYIQECKQVIKREMDKKEETLVFSQSMPWIESFFELGGEHHPATFLIMPTESQWKLRGIPPSYEERMQVRVPLPQKWAGLIGDQLRDVSGISGAVFCHKGRFTSIWETKEDALKALGMILDKSVS